MLGDDAAVVLTAGGVGVDDIELDKYQSFTLVRAADGWSIAAFQNTLMSDRARAARDH